MVKMLFISLIVLSALTLIQARIDKATDQDEFFKFMTKFNKNYLSLDEFSKRKDLFSQSMKKVIEHNSKTGNLYELGINHFSDWT